MSSCDAAQRAVYTAWVNGARLPQRKSKPKGKPLVDDIWHLVALTRREAFAGIPKKHADLMIELLEKIQSNFASLEPLQPMPAVAALQSGRASTGGARSRREQTASRS